MYKSMGKPKMTERNIRRHSNAVNKDSGNEESLAFDMLPSPLFLTQHELEQDEASGALILNNLDDYALQVEDGGRVSWYSPDESPHPQMINTGDFRFIVNKNGRIFAAPIRSETERDVPTFPLRPRFHHASLVGDEWPVYAGRAHAVNGEIYYINNHTGHFAQPKSDMPGVFEAFERQGAHISRAKEFWFKGHLYNPFKPDAPPTVMTLPLKDNPNGNLWGVYEDSQVTRTNLSPSEYRRRLIGYPQGDHASVQQLQ